MSDSGSRMSFRVRTRKRLRDAERTMRSVCFDQLFLASKVTPSSFSSSTKDTSGRFTGTKSLVLGIDKTLHFDMFKGRPSLSLHKSKARWAATTWPLLLFLKIGTHMVKSSAYFITPQWKILIRIQLDSYWNFWSRSELGTQWEMLIRIQSDSYWNFWSRSKLGWRWKQTLSWLFKCN